MDIFIINLNSIENVPKEMLYSFQGEKVFKNLKKRQEHCFSYLMVARILEHYYKIEDRRIEFIKNKPFLINRKKFFSISHSHDYVALAFSDSNCGIDIEKIVPRNYHKIANRFGFNCESLEDFYYDWTKYEAEYKLGSNSNILKSYSIEDYIITAVSENNKESFEFYIQN